MPIAGREDAHIEAALRQAMQQFGATLKLVADDALQERVARIVAASGLPVRFTDKRLNERVEVHRMAHGKDVER